MKRRLVQIGLACMCGIILLADSGCGDSSGTPNSEFVVPKLSNGRQGPTELKNTKIDKSKQQK